MSDIVVTKEDEGETLNLYASSSEDEVGEQPPLRVKPQRADRNMPPARGQAFRPAPKPQSMIPPNMLDAFTNPEKKLPPPPPSEAPSLDTSPYMDTDPYDQPPFDEDEYQPSEGFESLTDEKQDLIYKLYRLQSKGIPVSKKFNMESDIHEMRREYHRIVRDMEVNSSIKFSRRMLMACVTGIEFLNKRYDPFDIKLDGWSESLMENMDDYDNVFERLHDKYSSKAQMAPELELLLSIVGSAFMFHLTNSMMGSIPNLNDIAKSNPDIIQNLMKTMSSMQQGAPPPPPTDDRRTASTEGSASRDMKGPMFDMSAIMGMMNPSSKSSPPAQSTAGLIPSPPTPLPLPVSSTNLTAERISHPPTTRTSAPRPPSPPASLISSSDDAGSSLNTKTISFAESGNGTKRKKGRKPKVAADKTISI
jgi:hypothetical protein